MSFIFDDTLNLLNRGEFNFNQSYVGLSADKSTVIYGAPWNNDNQGVVYMFIHDGTHWEHQSTLTASDGAMGDWFGGSVSLTSDGSTALVGTWGKSSRTGATYVFTRSGSTWTQQAKLVASDAATSDRFGYSVSLSSDGSTALVGAYGKSSGTGAAYIFTQSGATWTQQSILTASDAATDDRFGYSVSLSSDGSCAAIEDKYGKVYVYTLRDGVWLEKPVKGNQTMKLIQLTEIDNNIFVVYIDNVQVRDLDTPPFLINAYMWNGEKYVFEHQQLTTPAGTRPGDLIFEAVTTNGGKVRIEVRVEKTATLEDLQLFDGGTNI